MILMVTSRRPKKKDDGYDDEEQSGYGYDYLYDYAGGQPGSDGFREKKKTGFESALLGNWDV